MVWNIDLEIERLRSGVGGRNVPLSVMRRMSLKCSDGQFRNRKWQTILKNHNTQYNKMHYIFPRYFILQYHVKHCYMFRALIGSSSGNRDIVTLQKTELAIHVHKKYVKKTNS